METLRLVTGRGRGEGRPERALRIAGLCSLLALAGCGLQADGGLHARAPHQAVPLSATVSGRLAKPRGLAPYVGGHVTLADPTPGRTLSLRNAMLAVGVRVPLSCVALELGPEAGLGEPTFVPIGGTGLYVGGSAAGLLRIVGDQDHTPGFAPAALLLDAVLTVRGGLWTPPASLGNTAELGDLSVHLGLRASIASDLAIADSDEWGRR